MVVGVMTNFQKNPVHGVLRDLLKTRALVRGQVKLASGQMSDYYVDCKRVTLEGAALRVASEGFWALLSESNPRPSHVAGVSVGGDPIVAGVLLAALEHGTQLGGLLVRKEPKAHGLAAGRAVDGAPSKECQGVWLLEDVISTGGSSLKAAGFLKAEGYPLKGVLTLIDREMGGVEDLRQKLGVPVEALFKVSELL